MNSEVYPSQSTHEYSAIRAVWLICYTICRIQWKIFYLRQACSDYPIDQSFQQIDASQTLVDIVPYIGVGHEHTRRNVSSATCKHTVSIVVYVEKICGYDNSFGQGIYICISPWSILCDWQTSSRNTLCRAGHGTTTKHDNLKLIVVIIWGHFGTLKSFTISFEYIKIGMDQVHISVKITCTLL